MTSISNLLQCQSSTDRRTYRRNILLLLAGKLAIDLQVMPLRPDLFQAWSWPMSWLNPFILIGPFLKGEAPLVLCFTTFAFFAALVWNSVHRARHIGVEPFTGLLAAVPFINVLVLALFAWAPGKRRSVFDLFE